MGYVNLYKQINILKNVPLFTSAEEKNLIRILNLLVKEEFLFGDDIIVENTEANKFYIIIKGKVNFYCKGEYIRTFEEGNFFGELSLLNNKKRSVTAKANSKEVICYSLSKSSFNEEIHAEIREKIKKSELEGIDIDEFEAQCIVIKLPKIPPSIRIVDTPGPSLKHFQVKIADFLKNSFMNILLYIVTTDNKSSLDLGEGRLLKSINKNNVHQFVYPIINKIDCLDKDLKQVNCFEKSESEKEIDYQDIVIHHQNQLNNLKSCLKNFQVLNLNILDKDTNKNNIKLSWLEIFRIHDKLWFFKCYISS
jgi:hypothetical protein